MLTANSVVCIRCPVDSVDSSYPLGSSGLIRERESEETYSRLLSILVRAPIYTNSLPYLNLNVL